MFCVCIHSCHVVLLCLCVYLFCVNSCAVLVRSEKNGQRCSSVFSFVICYLACSQVMPCSWWAVVSWLLCFFFLLVGSCAVCVRVLVPR